MRYIYNIYILKTRLFQESAGIYYRRGCGMWIQYIKYNIQYNITTAYYMADA